MKTYNIVTQNIQNFSEYVPLDVFNSNYESLLLLFD